MSIPLGSFSFLSNKSYLVCWPHCLMSQFAASQANSLASEDKDSWHWLATIRKYQPPAFYSSYRINFINEFRKRSYIFWNLKESSILERYLGFFFSSQFSKEKSHKMLISVLRHNIRYVLWLGIDRGDIGQMKEIILILDKNRLKIWSW
jgi:hypothetical protein